MAMAAQLVQTRPDVGLFFDTKRLGVVFNTTAFKKAFARSRPVATRSPHHPPSPIPSIDPLDTFEMPSRHLLDLSGDSP